MTQKKRVLVIGTAANPAVKLMELLRDPVMKPRVLEAFDIQQPNRAARRKRKRRS